MNGLAADHRRRAAAEAVRVLGRRRRADRGGQRLRPAASPTARPSPPRRCSASPGIVVILRAAAAGCPRCPRCSSWSCSRSPPRRLRPGGPRGLAGRRAPAGLPAVHDPDGRALRPGRRSSPGRWASPWSSLADTISTSSAFAARTGQEVDGNQEMIGIGAANIAAGLFQGFPVSTSGSRTAVAEQAGARSPSSPGWSARR